MSVCLSVSASISVELRYVPSSATFCACELWPCLGSPIAALRYVMYFRFMDDIVFAHRGPHGSMSIMLQRVTSLNRRAQANALAALYWLHRVLEAV